MKTRLKYKAFCMIFMTVLASLSMFVSLTAAWFVTVRNADVGTNGFQFNDTELIQGIKFYQYKSSGNGTISFNDEESPYEIGDGRYKADLGYYNLFESNYQTLMEITLTDEAVSGQVSIELTAKTFAEKSHLTANETGAPDYPLTNETGVYNSLSSIVDFFIFYESDLDFSSSSISLNRNDIKNVKNETTNKAISNFTNDKGEIVSSKMISLARFKANEIAVGGTAKLYLMFDYNEENCAKMYGNNIGNTAIENGHFNQDGAAVLKFAADFEFNMAVK